MEQISIVRAEVEDYQQIINLLTKSKLPTKGVEEILQCTYVAKDGEKIIGCAAIEMYNSSALLRSVAVDNSYRGKGVGLELTKQSIDLSLSNNIKEVFLLTETAENYFTKHGFNKISRSEAPIEIQQSEEFSAICPQSASVLKLEKK